MERILISWVGGHDVDGVGRNGKPIPGPILSTLRAESFDRVELVYNYSQDEKDVEGYLARLEAEINAPINAQKVDLSSPIAYGEIYVAAEAKLAALKESHSSTEFNILLSPGTPAMQVVWVLLNKTSYPAVLWQSSPEAGVQQADVPLEIAAEYVPSINTVSTEAISRLAGADVPADASFDQIITQNPHMQGLKTQATVLADTDVPVLIYGESGTGKELFAQAIHNASKRAGGPIKSVNCGAFPKELIDSVLFGHTKGAFSGAGSDKLGVFDQANGGTLFLDEFGELEPEVQVRLLRVLNDGTFTPVGGDKEKKVDVRIIAATNKDLMLEVGEGNFREDLFFRVAVGVLHLPPLRKRHGDIMLLTSCLLKAIGEEEDKLKNKKISPEGKNLILKHNWSGNIRELHSTLFRAALWSQSDVIGAGDIQQAMFDMPEKGSGVLGRDMSQGIDINEVISEVCVHYLERALAESGGIKKKSAQLLGLKSPQVLTTWMEKYGISQ